MPWDCFCPKCGAGNVGGMEDDPVLMEKEMDRYRGKTIKCDSCGCSHSFDTGEILIPHTSEDIRKMLNKENGVYCPIVPLTVHPYIGEEPIMKCEVCKKKESVKIKPYTVTIKEDTYSETIKDILLQGTLVTVHLPICQECLDKEEEICVEDK